MESDIYGSTSTQKTENQYSPDDMYAQTAPNSITADRIYSLNGLNVGGQFVVDANGNVTFSGNLSGATGTFSGSLTSQTITASNISSLNGLNVGNGNFVIDASGNVTLKGSIASGSNISGASITSQGTYGTITISGDTAKSTSTSNNVAQIFNGQFYAQASSGANAYYDSGGIHLSAPSGSSDTAWFQIGYLRLYKGGKNFSIQFDASGYSYFTSEGYSSPGYKFDNAVTVSGNISNGTLTLASNAVQSTNDAVLRAGSSNYAYLQGSQVQCTIPNSQSSYIPINASAFNVSSKREWKQNIKAYANKATDVINKASIYTYNFKDGWVTKKQQLGLIAEEAPNEVLDESGSLVNLYPMLTLAWKAIQELSAEIQDLKRKP